MSDKYTETGGGRVGFWNATWPMVELQVTKEYLSINGKVVGDLIFKPSDVIAIKPRTAYIHGGIQIIHKKREYNQKVIFWTKNSSENLIKKIKTVGFIPSGQDLSEKEKLLIKERDTFPLKWEYLIPYIFLNLIIVGIDFIFKYDNNIKLGLVFTLVNFISVNILLQTSKKFRSLILKKGKTLDDIGTLSLLLIFAAGYNLFMYLIKVYN